MSYITFGFDAKLADPFVMSSTPPVVKSPSRIAGLVAWCSWINLGLMLAISWLLFAISENWWFSSALTYAPRMPYLIPAIGLLVASLVWHRSSVAVNLIAVAMVAGPIMGLSLPVSRWMGTAVTNGATLKVLSCNVQSFKPDFASVLAEVGRCNPDLVAFQDARGQSKLLDRYFEKWNVVRDGEFFVASRFPVKLVQVGHFDPFDRDAVLHCEVELPATTVAFFNIHQMTPRHGLRALDISSPLTQRGSEKLSHYLELRSEEATSVRDFVEGSRGKLPTVIVGDFNTPCESNLYHQNWLGYQNAFNTAGAGYGYSFPCTRQYCWPAGVPWMRLDHILADDAWQVRSCLVGSANGSDHRLITATLVIPKP